jgi:small subunit ribosomal protein S2
MDTEVAIEKSPLIEALFSVGAHYGYKRSRRHPSVAPYIFGLKNRVEIFDLEKTSGLLEAAKAFVRTLGKEGKTMLLVGGKPEAREAVRAAAARLGMPYVAGRWIGGTLTNFSEIKKRLARFADLRASRESGELGKKYTKKERLLLDREIARLEENFGGVTTLTGGPVALFVVDPGHEHTAVREAARMKLHVVALAGSDCNITSIDHAIIGNDSSRRSITFFVEAIAQAYEEGKAEHIA